MVSFCISWPSTTLALSSCFPSSQLGSVDPLCLSSKGLRPFLFLIGSPLNNLTDLLILASNSISFLFRLLQENLAILDYFVMDIRFSCTNRFAIARDIIPVGSLNLCCSAWMYSQWVLTNQRSHAYLQIPAIVSFFKLINMDGQSFL
jgi:hypothetical protein